MRPLREEIASATIQGTAAAASAVGLIYLVTKALPRQDALELGALTTYGVSMFIAFLASALYHAVQHQRARSVLQRVDHCTIFLLIAGTYTPFVLIAPAIINRIGKVPIFSYSGTLQPRPNQPMKRYKGIAMR